MSSTHDVLEELRVAINSSVDGDDSARFLEGSSSRLPDDQLIRTGSLSTDMALGTGGLTRGKIHEIHGPYSSGKTTLALHAVRNAQRSGVPCVFIDAEYALNPTWMRKLGINTSEVLVMQPSSLENAIDTMIAVAENSPGALFVFDSVAASKSKSVMEADAETETRQVEARRWSIQMTRIVEACHRTNTTGIFINQTRDTTDRYGNPMYTTPGGSALKFAYYTQINIKRVVKEGRREETGVEFSDVTVDVVKNKGGSPFVKGHYTIRKNQPIDRYEDIIGVALEYGIIQEDTKYDDDGDATFKKGWLSIPLTPEDVEAIREDYPEYGEGRNEGETYFQAYQTAKFWSAVTPWHSFLDRLEDRILDSLNEGDVPDGVDSETGEVAEEE